MTKSITAEAYANKKTRMLFGLILILTSLILFDFFKRINSEADTRPWLFSTVGRDLSTFSEEPVLCVITSVEENIEPSELVLYLLATSENYKSAVYTYLHVNGNSKRVSKVAKITNKIIGFNHTHILPKMNIDYRDFAIANLECDYYLFSSIHSIYVANFVDDFLLADMQTKHELIGFNYISPKALAEPSRYRHFYSDGTKLPAKNDFHQGKMITSAMLVSKELLKRNHFVKFSKYSDESEFILELVRNSRTKMVHSEILLIVEE